VKTDFQGDFVRKGKKYKTKYFDALGQLFGELEHDKDCQSEDCTNGVPGTGQIRRLAEENGNKTLS
jgi:hypothetical protein